MELWRGCWGDGSETFESLGIPGKYEQSGAGEGQGKKPWAEEEALRGWVLVWNVELNPPRVQAIALRAKCIYISAFALPLPHSFIQPACLPNWALVETGHKAFKPGNCKRLQTQGECMGLTHEPPSWRPTLSFGVSVEVLEEQLEEGKAKGCCQEYWAPGQPR